MAVQGERLITVTRRERLYEKVCPICGRTFTGLARQRYCTPTCVRKADYARHAAARREARRSRYRRERDGGEGAVQ